jgi:hypothetical protein
MIRAEDDRGDGMKYRIAAWAGLGFLIAGLWAIYVSATFPDTSERIRDLWTLVSLTCPIAIAGRHHAISLYEVLVANSVTYAMLGILVETLRRQYAKHFKL